MDPIDMEESGMAARIGETVAEALRRLEPEMDPALATGPVAVSREAREARWVARLAHLLAKPIAFERILNGPPDASGDPTPVWVRDGEPRTVEQVLKATAVPLSMALPASITQPSSIAQPPSMAQPASMALPATVPVVTRAEPDEERLFGEEPLPHMTRSWRPVTVVAGCVMLLALVALVRAIVPRGARAPAVELPTDAEYQTELSREIEDRCVTWQAELKDAQALIAAANIEPVRLTLRTDDVFSGTRNRPRLLVEGKLRDPESASPLRQAPRGGLTVRTYHDRQLDGGRGVLRTIEASF